MLVPCAEEGSGKRLDTYGRSKIEKFLKRVAIASSCRDPLELEAAA